MNKLFFLFFSFSFFLNVQAATPNEQERAIWAAIDALDDKYTAARLIPELIKIGNPALPSEMLDRLDNSTGTLHSMYVDTISRIGDFEALQRLISALTPSLAGKNSTMKDVLVWPHAGAILRMVSRLSSKYQPEEFYRVFSNAGIAPDSAASFLLLAGLENGAVLVSTHKWQDVLLELPAHQNHLESLEFLARNLTDKLVQWFGIQEIETGLIASLSRQTEPNSLVNLLSILEQISKSKEAISKDLHEDLKDQFVRLFKMRDPTVLRQSLKLARQLNYNGSAFEVWKLRLSHPDSAVRADAANLIFKRRYGYEYGVAYAGGIPRINIFRRIMNFIKGATEQVVCEYFLRPGK